MNQPSIDTTFPANYSVALPIDQARIDAHFKESFEDERDDVLFEVSLEGAAWVGGARAAPSSVNTARTEIHTTPNPDRILVVANGRGYLIDAGDPRHFEVLATGGPITGSKALPELGLLLLSTPWTVTAIGPRGAAWRSDRLAIDGLELGDAVGESLRGRSDPGDDGEREFCIDLRTGRHTGGAGISG